MEDNEEKQLILNEGDLAQPVFVHINNLVSRFNLPRDILASQDEIKYAWKELPREIERIPEQLRNELIVRMCIAASVGLFDGAINYIWNAVILNLRNKIFYLGLNLVGQALNKKFDEADLKELKDIELIELCYKFELLSEEGYYFLNQCRDIRNKFSVAHPSIANIDDRELITFISRCSKYGITEDYKCKGINIDELLKTLDISSLDDQQIGIIINKFMNTFEAQRQLLIPMLYSKYCDPNSTQISRNNCLKLCLGLKEYCNDKIISTLLERHREYILKDKEQKGTASTIFFEKMDMVKYLEVHEQHTIYKNACNNLYNAHNGWDNFSNEVPFAERLFELSKGKRPETVMEEYVYTIVLCYVGNPYGVSRNSIKYYENMIRNFSPKEIDFLLMIYFKRSILKERIDIYSQCRERYKLALNLIEKNSMNSQQIEKYNKIIK